MKIFCVGMNYANSSNGSSLGAECPEQPLSIYLKPDTALARNDWPVYVPDFTQEFEYATELVVKICRLGKSIPARFAHRYYEEVTVGINFTARDMQRDLQQRGLPWEVAKGFDSSSFCGNFVKLDGRAIQDLHFGMKLNGQTRQEGHTAQMLYSVDQIIEYISRFYILKTGDLIFTGTPAGIGTVKEGDEITATLDGTELLNCKIK